jgi:hypothetical protein
MDQYEYIRTAHRVYQKSIRQIQKETGHSRVTIRKVLHGEFPEYKRRSAQAYPVLEKHRETIRSWAEGRPREPEKNSGIPPAGSTRASSKRKDTQAAR